MTVKGQSELLKKLKALPPDMRAGIGKALAVSVIEMDAYAKQKIQGGGRTGAVYKRGKKTHQASAPGEFPKTDHGQLVASLFFRVSRNKLSAVFGSPIVYARWLEYGTSRMQPRPWLRPTFVANENKARERIDAAVQEALRKAASGV